MNSVTTALPQHKKMTNIIIQDPRYDTWQKMKEEIQECIAVEIINETGTVIPPYAKVLYLGNHPIWWEKWYIFKKDDMTSNDQEREWKFNERHNPLLHAYCKQMMIQTLRGYSSHCENTQWFVRWTWFSKVQKVIGNCEYPEKEWTGYTFMRDCMKEKNDVKNRGIYPSWGIKNKYFHTSYLKILQELESILDYCVLFSWPDTIYEDQSIFSYNIKQIIPIHEIIEALKNSDNNYEWITQKHYAICHNISI